MKWRWHLSVNQNEKSWLCRHLAGCGWPSVQRPTRPSISITISGGGGGGGGGGTGSGGGSSTGGVKIVSIYFDSPGSDSGSNSSLNAEWVKVKNVSNARKAVTGWTLGDASSHIYRFPATDLAAGSTLRVHTGRGSNNARNRYWGSSSYIWNNTGDVAKLRNSGGTLVDRCSYTSAADPVTTC